MNLQIKKLDIVRMLLNTNDKGLIQEVKTIGAGWWDEMSGQQKKVVLEGLAQSDSVSCRS